MGPCSAAGCISAHGAPVDGPPGHTHTQASSPMEALCTAFLDVLTHRCPQPTELPWMALLDTHTHTLLSSGLGCHPVCAFPCSAFCSSLVSRCQPHSCMSPLRLAALTPLPPCMATSAFSLLLSPLTPPAKTHCPWVIWLSFHQHVLRSITCAPTKPASPSALPKCLWGPW